MDSPRRPRVLYFIYARLSEGVFVNRLAFLATALLAALALSSAAHAQAPAPLLTSADQVIQRYEQAIGGHDAWDKLQTFTAKGNLELKGQFVLGGFESEQATPARSIRKFISGGRAVFAAGCNDQTCWSYDPKGGLHPLTGDELTSEIADADFYADLHLRNRFKNLRLVGTESQGASSTYVLETAPNTNTFVRLYFDADTGFKTREVVTTQDSTGQHIVTTIFEDYHQTNGVVIPYTIRSSDPEFAIRISQVEWNKPIDDAKFAMPSLESLQPPPKLVVAPHNQAAPGAGSTSGASDLRPDSGNVVGNTYRNDYFNFTYQFPEGWSVAPAATTDRLMEAGRAAAAKGSEEKKVVLDAAAQHTYPMLTVTRYPFGTPGKLNQIIQMVSEDLSYAPGLNQSKDYLDLVTRAVLNVSAGYEVLQDGKPMTFGGKNFYAGELMKRGPVPIYQWYACTVEDGMALTFIFTAPTAAAADVQLRSLSSLAFSK
jgi:hypothetical protein